MKSEMEFQCYNEPGPNTLQRIERVTLEAARLLAKADQAVESTTGRIRRGVMEVLRREGYAEKIEKCEQAIKRHESAFVRGLSQILKNLKGD